MSAPFIFLPSMEEDWDLQAVVRGYSGSATRTRSSSNESLSCFSDGQSGKLFSIIETLGGRGELEDVYKPFFPRSYFSSPATSVDESSQSWPRQSHSTDSTNNSASSNSISCNKSKRRKNETKKVCQVAVEDLCSDIWAWRKYGQKPIKGSPYPRGYYRCSSSKGCLARKQVERNRTDCKTFIVTYTAEHNHPAPIHRNSLAGSTRHKPVVTTEFVKPAGDTSSFKLVLTSLTPSMDNDLLSKTCSPSTESTESTYTGEDIEDDEFGISNIILDDDLFKGLEEFAGECFTGYNFL